MRNRKRRAKGKWSKKVRKVIRPYYEVSVRNMIYNSRTKEFVYTDHYSPDFKVCVRFNTAHKARNMACHLADKHSMLVDVRKTFWSKNARWMSHTVWFPNDVKWNEENILIAGDYITLLRKIDSVFWSV